MGNIKFALEKLPRKYFYEIETKYTDVPPQNTIFLLGIPLVFNILAIYFSTFSYDENPFIFYFSIASALGTLILMLINLLLKDSYINPPKTIRNLKVFLFQLFSFYFHLFHF